MKMTPKPNENELEDLDNCETTAGKSRPVIPGNAEVAKQFRLLKGNELVVVGDYIAGKHDGFEPWEGPGGFRADSFVMAVYRNLGARSPR
jgi:hypothetical protein